MIRLLLAIALLVGATHAQAATCTPSPNGTVIQNGAAGTLLDGACNKWSVAAGVVSENGALAGFTANVTEIAIVSGTVWHLNTSGQWYDWLPASSTWGPPGGTMVNPLPVVVVTPPPSTGLTAAQQAAVALVTADLAKLMADAATDGNDLTKYQTDYAAMLTALGVTQ